MRSILRPVFEIMFFAIRISHASDNWENRMRRSGSAALALTILGFVSGAAIAQTKMDCSRMYKDFWEKLDREKFAKIPAAQLAGVSRLALRAYDACQAGDALEAKELFDRLKMTLY